MDSYLHRESIKEIAGRRYDGEEKAWYIPLTERNVGFLQLLGTELDEELRAEAVPTSERVNAAAPVQRMPIRADPYSHQITAFNFAIGLYESGKKGVAVLADMGTGKTLITIALAGALFGSGKIKRLLVICPKSILLYLKYWESLTVREIAEKIHKPRSTVQYEIKGIINKLKRILDKQIIGEI